MMFKLLNKFFQMANLERNDIIGRWLKLCRKCSHNTGGKKKEGKMTPKQEKIEEMFERLRVERWNARQKGQGEGEKEVIQTYNDEAHSRPPNDEAYSRPPMEHIDPNGTDTMLPTIVENLDPFATTGDADFLGGNMFLGGGYEFMSMEETNAMEELTRQSNEELLYYDPNWQMDVVQPAGPTFEEIFGDNGEFPDPGAVWDVEADWLF